MKTNYLKYTPALLMALFASSNASALSYGGTAAADHLQYIEGPVGVLTADPGDTASLATIIAGGAFPLSSGGNTELFASSDGMSNAAYNLNTNTTTLEVGFNSGNSLSLSSLTAADWGAGPGSLLETWSTAILTEYFPIFTPGDLTAFQAAFVASGGRQRLSDPNIAYVNADGGVAHIGLAGFLDASVFNSSLPPAASGLIPVGAQISEIVKVTENGGAVSYLYAVNSAVGSSGFNSALPSKVSTADGSYNGTFDFELPGFDPGTGVNVPEPTGLALLVVGLTGFLSLRRKAVKS